MTTFRQIADQLHDALRDLYENGASCPDDKVLRARDAYDAACAPVSKSTAKRIAALSSGGTHWNECWRDHHECAIARVGELERTAAAWKKVIADRAKLWPDEMADIENSVAELLKEKEHG